MRPPRHTHHGFLLIGLLMCVQGCVSSSYSGAEYAPTQDVAVYHDDAAVPADLLPMGTVRTTAPPGMTLQSIQFELVEQARRRGADAIVIDRTQLETIGYRTDPASGQPERVIPADHPGAGGKAIREQVVIARLLKRSSSS